MSLSAYTVALFKPDSVRRRLVGPIVSEIERADLVVAQAVMARFSTAEAEEFYAEHAARPFFGPLIEFTTSGPLYVVHLTGREDAATEVVYRWRDLMGPSSPAMRPPGSIRGRWACGCREMENLVHGSDSPVAAKREKALLERWRFL